MPNLTQTLRLAVALSLCVLALPATVQAHTNVAPNPGFESTLCSDAQQTVCGWSGDLIEPGWLNITRDTENPHQGDASMQMVSDDSGVAWTPCLPFVPGIHPVSFWYRTPDSIAINVEAQFFVKANCVGTASYSEMPWDAVLGGDEWQPAYGGSVEAPPRTVSAIFTIGAGALDWFTVHFDDVYIDADPNSR